MESERTLIAKVPKRPNQNRFPKEDFTIDLKQFSCTCPAGQVTTDLRRRGHYDDGTPRQNFRLDPAVCDCCPLRVQCVAAQPGRGRQVALHPQEVLLQQARALQQSEAFAPSRYGKSKVHCCEP